MSRLLVSLCCNHNTALAHRRLTFDLPPALIMIDLFHCIANMKAKSVTTKKI